MMHLLSRRIVLALLAVAATLGAAGVAQAAQTALADSPILATSQVPPNIMLTLSVEWPTGVVAAYGDNASTVPGHECAGRVNGMSNCYFTTRTYLGYFDPAKCYTYDTTKQYFLPATIVAVGASCGGSKFSGNYLNWAQTHALDGFRFAMTGGDRYIDTGPSGTPANTTVIEKSFHSGQGGLAQFPIKIVQSIPTTDTPPVPAVPPSTVSPYSWPTMYARVTSDDQVPLGLGTTRAGRVVQFSNNTQFMNNFPSTMKYIMVQLAGSGALSLGEVQVYGPSTATWSTSCASENGTCTFSGTGPFEVEYGAGTSFFTQVFTGSSTPCSNGVFGDPDPGVGKACYYRALPSANLAQASGAAATQVSTASGGNASNAKDGSTTTSSLTSNSAANDWWQLNLGSAKAVRAIIITAGSNTLQQYYVYGSTNDMSGKSIDTIAGDNTIWKYYTNAAASVPNILDPDPTYLLNGFAATDYLLARVQVCNSSIGLEANCVAYGTTYKPTGVVQNNADKMRFGVMSYTNVDGTQTMGGVLRSGLKALGPNTIAPIGTPVANSRAEITSGGLLVPDSESLAGTNGVKASGVISYLNEFGKLGTKTTLKSNDTVSELFYEAVRYVRGDTASTPAFTSFSGATTVAAYDGFPYFTDWTNPLVAQPIQYSCQKNYFVGIGDTNTWCDSYGPGNSATARTSSCGGHTGAPTDTQIANVLTLDNLLGANEAATTTAGLTAGGALGSTYIDTSRGDVFDIAGYAFWANTHDIVPDDNSKPWTIGKQSAQFYWVDVRESGSFNGDPAPKNEYWLAGKYGGFPSSTTSTDSTQEYPSSSYDPLNQNYFTGDRPDTLITALQSVFNSILAKQQSNAAASLSSNNLSVPGSAYLVRYNSSNWTGEIIGDSTSFDVAGNFTSTQQWAAAALLDTTMTTGSSVNWDTGRKIATFSGSAGVPFRGGVGSQMSSTQLGYFGSSVTNQNDLINYLRGNTTYETGTSAKFRARVHQLGDIVNSAPTLMVPPADGLAETYNAGYAAFASANAARTPVLFVGANDGMLHAFNATVSPAAALNGTELFAYVPSAVLSGPSSPATPTVDGIASRANLTLAHHELVDGQQAIQSVDFAKTGGATGGTPDWRTLLVGGLGKGGRSFYALDVTKPTDWSSEAAVAGKVLWEYTDADAGYSYGTPLIVKTAQYGWVVIVSSGYNNVNSGQTGNGWISILNAKTGHLIQKLTVKIGGVAIGSTTTPVGLARISGFAPDRTDFTVDSVYGGDLLGHVWRFDLTAATGSYPDPTLMTTLKDASSNAQAITVAPGIGVTVDSLQRWIFIGTGQLQALSDMSTTAQQTFYAIHDGTNGRFATTAAGGAAFPFDSRSGLTPLATADLSTGKALDTTKNGWYHDLDGVASNGATERMVNSPDAQQGLVVFITQTPSTDACLPGVASRIYALNYQTGLSAILNTTGTTSTVAPYYTSPDTAFGVDVVVDANGKLQIMESTVTPTLTKIPDPKQNGVGPLLKLNWREILQ